MKYFGARTQGALSLFGAAVLQATYGPLTREMVVMFGTFAQVAFRLGMGCLMITLFNMTRRRFVRLPTGSGKKVAFLGLIWYCNVALFTVSVMTTSIATSVFVMYAASITSSLAFGVLLQKEPMTYSKMPTAALAIAGLVIYTDGARIHVGALAALAAGIIDGLSNIVRKRLKEVDGYTLLQYQSAVSAVAAVGIALAIPERSIHHTSMIALAAGFIYGILALIRNKILHFGIHHFDTHAGAIILASQLFFAALFGAILYGEIPTVTQLQGGLLIFLSAVICVTRRAHAVRLLGMIRQFAGSA